MSGKGSDEMEEEKREVTSYLLASEFPFHSLMRVKVVDCYSPISHV